MTGYFNDRELIKSSWFNIEYKDNWVKCEILGTKEDIFQGETKVIKTDRCLIKVNGKIKEVPAAMIYVAKQ